MMPCDSAATAEPPMKAQSQNHLVRGRTARQRNSNATPRKISASSMAITSG